LSHKRNGVKTTRITIKSGGRIMKNTKNTKNSIIATIEKNTSKESKNGERTIQRKLLRK
jgi:hypothetical protein